MKELGDIPPPITQEGPKSVPGENDLTQDFKGPLTDETYKTRGYSVPGKVCCYGCYKHAVECHAEEKADVMVAYQQIVMSSIAGVSCSPSMQAISSSSCQ